MVKRVLEEEKEGVLSKEQKEGKKGRMEEGEKSTSIASPLEVDHL